MSNRERIAYLVINIINNKKAYYSGYPLISDYDYDSLEMELKKLDPYNPVNFLVGYDDSYNWWLNHYNEYESIITDLKGTN